MQPQLNPSNPEIDNRIREIEDLLIDAGRQSDTENIKYLKDYLGFLKSYQKIKHSYKFINDLAAGDDEDGEVNAARFIKRHFANEGNNIIKINSKTGTTGNNKGSSAPQIPLSDKINEMGVPQVTQEQEPFQNEVSKDYNGTPISTTDINDPNFFPSSGRDRNTTIDDIDIENRSLNNRTYSLKGFDKFSHTDEYRRDTEEMGDGEADKEFTAPIIENESQNTARNIGKTGDNKMWINSKLAIDENGDIKEACDVLGKPNNDAGNPIDDTISSEKENAVVSNTDKVSFVMKSNTEKFFQLESIISKMAFKKDINNIEEVNIKLSKNNGEMEIKVAESIDNRATELAKAFMNGEQEYVLNMLKGKSRLVNEVYKWLKEYSSKFSEIFRNSIQSNIEEFKTAFDRSNEVIKQANYELKKWIYDKDYSGEDYSDYYIVYGRNRDSEALVNSNFDEILKMLGGESDPEVIVTRAGHWGPGWIELILVHETAQDKLAIAQDIINQLNDYPVLNEEDLSEREYTEWNEAFEQEFNYNADSELEEFADESGLVPEEVLDKAKQLARQDDEISQYEPGSYPEINWEALKNKLRALLQQTSYEDKEQQFENAGQEKLPFEGEKKMGMWINSKLMLDDEGNIKQAEMEKEAWNFDKKNDEEKKEEKGTAEDEAKDEKKDASVKLSAEEYAELESFISRIAQEKGIDGVSEISINLSKEAGVIEFKVTEFKKDDDGIGSEPAMSALPMEGPEEVDALINEEEPVV